MLWQWTKIIFSSNAGTLIEYEEISFVIIALTQTIEYMAKLYMHTQTRIVSNGETMFLEARNKYA